MADFIVCIIIGAMLFFAIRYIINQKKNGAKCIGCSQSTCPHCKKAN